MLCTSLNTLIINGYVFDIFENDHHYFFILCVKNADSVNFSKDCHFIVQVKAKDLREFCHTYLKISQRVLIQGRIDHLEITREYLPIVEHFKKRDKNNNVMIGLEGCYIIVACVFSFLTNSPLLPKEEEEEEEEKGV